MFVPVACSQCGKPFQVPDTAVGQPTACPWCQAAVLALPVGGPPPGPPPAAEPPEPRPIPARQPTPEPLPLDDAPQPPAPPARHVPLWAIVGLAVLVGVAVTTATMGILRHKQGYMTGVEWRAFTAPDNSCAADLLGRAVEDRDDPPADVKRFVSEGWYSGTAAWVGWRDLTVHQAGLVGLKDGWLLLKPLFEAEQTRLKAKFGGAVTKDATRFDDPITHEFRLDSPGGRVVERMIVKPDGSRPRVYFVGMAGKNLDPDGPAARRLFDSFRVLE